MELITRTCAHCGQIIPTERLEVMPETQLCVHCSQAVGGEFIMIAIPERTSKQGSLKLNYGGCTFKKVRRQIKPPKDEQTASA